MPIELLVAGYVALLLGAIFALSFYYERRQKRFGPTPSADRIFRCKRCAWVYTDDADVDRSRCPHCGRLNAAIQF
jgi:hypothetical protein